MFEDDVVPQDADVAVEGGQPTEGNPTPATPNPLEPGGVRFEQVYGKMKDFEQKYNSLKELGDPNDIRLRLDRLSQYEKALEEHRKKAAQTPSEQATAQRNEAIRKELFDVYPELKDVSSLRELREMVQGIQSQIAEKQMETTLEKASQRFTDVLKTNKIDTKYQNKIEEYLISQMSREQMKQFASGDFSVAEEIFNNELKDGLFSAMRVKTPPPTPALRNTPGGTPPSSNQNKIKTLEEAAAEGFARMHNRE